MPKHLWMTLACGVLVVACSQEPIEPAPAFILPLSRVTTSPPSQKNAAATASAPHQLRYVAVPPGHKVAGMAHARIAVKKTKATSHRPNHAHKKAIAGATAVRKSTETTEPATKP